MHNSEFSPKAYARFAGLLYLVVILGGVFEIIVVQRLVVTGDAATTVRNILAHAQLVRLGFVAELVPVLCNVLLALIFYELFKIVSKRVALLVVFFSLVGSAIEASTLIGHLAPLVLLSQGHATGIDPILLQTEAYAALKLQSLGLAVALTFFGGYCLAMAYLIYRSSFIPRIIGVLLAIEGLCYLANSFTDFLAPAIAGRVFVFLLVSGVAEAIFCLWLLFRGLNAAKWREKANAPG